jgi:hypothetical protein
LPRLRNGGTVKQSKPTALNAAITIGSNLTQINVCQAVPQQDIKAVMGHKLAKSPTPFGYYDESGASGCWYEANKDADGEAHYGYFVFTPINVYNHQPLYLEQDVSGIGTEAYLNNGEDARQR